MTQNCECVNTHTHVYQCDFLTGVDELSLRVLQNLQGFHVVIEVLKHSSAFTQDAVSREQSLLLLQQQGHVVIGVARREEHSGENTRQPAFNAR